MTMGHLGVGSSISDVASVYSAPKFQRGNSYAEYEPALAGEAGDPEVTAGSRVFRYSPPSGNIEFSTLGGSGQVAWVSVYAYFQLNP
jgi:hypothetical protein